MKIIQQSQKLAGQNEPAESALVVATRPRDNNYFGQVNLHKVSPPISFLPKFMRYGMGELQYREDRGYMPGDIHAAMVIAKEHYERVEPDSATTDWAQFVLVSIAIIETQMRMDYRLAYLTLKDWEQRLTASTPASDRRTIVDQLLKRSVDYAASVASQKQFEVLPPISEDKDRQKPTQAIIEPIQLPRPFVPNEPSS